MLGRETGTIRSFMVGTGGTIGSGQEPVRVNNLTPRFHRPPLKRGLLIYPLPGSSGVRSSVDLTTILRSAILSVRSKTERTLRNFILQNKLLSPTGQIP